MALDPSVILTPEIDGRRTWRSLGVLVGKSPARRLPAVFFLNKIQSPVYPFESPNFLPTAKNKQVKFDA